MPSNLSVFLSELALKRLKQLCATTGASQRETLERLILEQPVYTDKGLFRFQPEKSA